MSRIYLASNLTYLRSKNRYSAEYVLAQLKCKGVRITLSAYSAFENREIEPSVRVLYALATLYKVTIEDLCFGQLRFQNHKPTVNIYERIRIEQNYDTEKRAGRSQGQSYRVERMAAKKLRQSGTNEDLRGPSLL